MKSASSAKAAEYEKKLASMKATIAAKDSAMEQQLIAVKKVAQTEAEHAKRRNEGEMADLRATIRSLEASLQKVSFLDNCAHLFTKLTYKPRQIRKEIETCNASKVSCKPSHARPTNFARNSASLAKSIPQR